MNGNKSDPLLDRLPFLLKRENIAQYEDGIVIIGDRRSYPFEKHYVRCADVEAVAQAIETMVTQGGGPWVAAVYALAMTARQNADKTSVEQQASLEAARYRLAATRPTNTTLHRQLESALQVGLRSLEAGREPELAILEWIEMARDDLQARIAQAGRYGADLIDDGDGILTMCFAESSFLLGLACAVDSGKSIRVYVPETRPYLQGARLTAPSVQEMGIPVQLITDNMPAYLMSQGKISKYFTAADLVTMDGHVVNKIGTFQNAVTAHYHGIPFFAYSWGPDPHKPNRASIEVEERDPGEIRRCRGTATTIDAIPAYYPAFDITPPHLVAGVITDRGVISPYQIKNVYGVDK